jgi:hypothetical protein
MGTQPGVATGDRIGTPEIETDLLPLRVVQATEAGGWTVVNLETLKVVEPGYVWPKREQAVRWARDELDRERAEEAEYRRRRDAQVRRGVSWTDASAADAAPNEA